MTTRRSLRRAIASSGVLVLALGLLPAVPSAATVTPEQAGLWWTSQTPDGKPSHGDSYLANVTDDGKLVVFWSNGDDLVDGEDSHFHVLLRDRTTGVTSILDRSPDGDVGNGAAYEGDISADGRFVRSGRTRTTSCQVTAMATATCSCSTARPATRRS